MLAPCKVIPQENEKIFCHFLDLDSLPSPSELYVRPVDRLIAEIGTDSSDVVIAYRGNQRWLQSYESVKLNGDSEPLRRLRERGVYMITGGLGRIGLLLAEYLARTAQAKLILTGRTS